MAVERYWHQPHGWFASLSTDQQAAVMADYRLTVREQKMQQPPKQVVQQRGGRRGT